LGPRKQGSTPNPGALDAPSSYDHGMVLQRAVGAPNRRQTAPLLLALASVACSPQARRSDPLCEATADGARTLARSATSPDGRHRALVLLTNGGPTTPLGAVVCVEAPPPGPRARRLLAWSGRSGGATLAWRSNRELAVERLAPDEPLHVFDIGRRGDAPLGLPRSGGLGCSGAPPTCPRLHHCAIDETCWRDGQDPDPAVVRGARLRREGVELAVTFDDGGDRSDVFTLVDAGAAGYEASRYRYPAGATTPLVLTPAERAALLAAASSLPYARAASAPPGRCARVTRSERWRTVEAYVCAPATAPLLARVAALLGRRWP